MAHGPALELVAQVALPLAQLLVTVLAVAVPGWTLARRLALDPLTKLVVASVAGFALLYLLTFGAFLVEAPAWTPFIAQCCVAIIGVASSVRRSRMQPSVRIPLLGLAAWVALAAWILAFQARIQVYGGGFWYGDWWEHYERAVFFLDRLPPDTRFLDGQWRLAARGPAFNAAAAALMAVLGRAFADYQVIATTFNAWPVLPMALLLRDLGRLRTRTALLASAVLFALAPFAVQHELWTWTKAFTLGFILGGIHLHRLALARGRPWIGALALLTCAMGVLAHYLALPFVLAIGLHFAWSAMKRRWGWRCVVTPLVACSALIATWLGYLVATMGWRATLTSNSTFGDYSQRVVRSPGTPQARGGIMLGNLATSVVPCGWRHDLDGVLNAPRILQFDPRAGEAAMPAPSELNRRTEWLSDLAGNQQSLLGMLGWAGSFGLLVVTAGALREIRSRGTPAVRRPAPSEPGWRFWTAFVVVGIPLNVALSPDFAPQGVAHLNQSAYICLAAVLIARWRRHLSGLAAPLLAAVFVVESSLGSGALVALQERRVPMVLQPDGSMATHGKVGLDPVYLNNYAKKLREGAVFLSDRLGDLATPFSLVALTLSLAIGAAALPDWRASRRRRGRAPPA